jgi:hypothetical protein
MGCGVFSNPFRVFQGAHQMKLQSGSLGFCSTGGISAPPGYSYARHGWLGTLRCEQEQCRSNARRLDGCACNRWAPNMTPICCTAARRSPLRARQRYWADTFEMVRAFEKGAGCAGQAVLANAVLVRRKPYLPTYPCTAGLIDRITESAKVSTLDSVLIIGIEPPEDH